MMGAVAPDKILKELDELWVSMGHQESQGEGGQGVLRACTMTLVVIAEESEDAAGLGETMAALMPEHPARTIVIRLRGAGERALSQRVYAQCWMPFGQRRQICCEQVEITASDAALPDLPSVVLPLAVPDLPLVLWCRSGRLLDLPVFRRVVAMAQKVVLDSSALPDAPLALATVARIVGQGLAAGDLAWTRLTRWREMVADVFENRRNLAGLAGAVRVTVEHAGPAVTTLAMYLAAWVKDAIPQAEARIRTAPDPGLIIQSPGFELRLEHRGGRMITTLNGVSQCTSLPSANDYLLMREELGIVRRDPVFEKTLASAARLAYPTD